MSSTNPNPRRLQTTPASM